jgi:hypothetical protein
VGSGSWADGSQPDPGNCFITHLPSTNTRPPPPPPPTNTVFLINETGTFVPLRPTPEASAFRPHPAGCGHFQMSSHMRPLTQPVYSRRPTPLGCRPTAIRDAPAPHPPADKLLRTQVGEIVAPVAPVKHSRWALSRMSNVSLGLHPLERREGVCLG